MKGWKVTKTDAGFHNLFTMPKGSIPIAVKEIPETLFNRIDDDNRAADPYTVIRYEITYLMPIKI